MLVQHQVVGVPVELLERERTGILVVNLTNGTLQCNPSILRFCFVPLDIRSERLDDKLALALALFTHTSLG